VTSEAFFSLIPTNNQGDSGFCVGALLLVARDSAGRGLSHPRAHAAPYREWALV